MRAALACLIVVAAAAILVVIVASDRDSGAEDEAPGQQAGVLVSSPRQVMRECRRAAARVPMPARCPSSVSRPDGEWGRARKLVGDRCGYLVDVEPRGRAGQPGSGSIYHLLFGGRCRRFDLSVAGGRWPAGGFFADDLRLVGRRSLSRGETTFRPARARVDRRLRIGDRSALLLSYPPQPLTTVHSGHLAIVWNEADAGYVVSGHPSEPVDANRRRAIEALRAMAHAMHAATLAGARSAAQRVQAARAGHPPEGVSARPDHPA